ncbi:MULTISPECIES: glycosyltransferase [unclassified Kitasatospora]|uniref:glycosyltransferase n=1 Tax=unclassified Kitasatospora TaxID=2633591 RepID=UPI0009E6C2D4|nr:MULTISPECIES: glycosyltransferase [unclassified Kitasatospora]
MTMQSLPASECLDADMVDALWLADLVIGRAGATTLAEPEALSKPAVLVPLPASVSGGDQLDNAKAYARRATCVVVADEEMATGSPSFAPASNCCPRCEAPDVTPTPKPSATPRGTSPPGRLPSPARGGRHAR